MVYGRQNGTFKAFVVTAGRVGGKSSWRFHELRGVSGVQARCARKRLLLGERAINRLTQRDVGAMIDRERQKWYNHLRPATRAVRLCVGDCELHPDMRARIPDQSRGLGLAEVTT